MRCTVAYGAHVRAHICAQHSCTIATPLCSAHAHLALPRLRGASIFLCDMFARCWRTLHRIFAAARHIMAARNRNSAQRHLPRGWRNA
jgi:hypothetical protein